MYILKQKQHKYGVFTYFYISVILNLNITIDASTLKYNTSSVQNKILKKMVAGTYGKFIGVKTLNYRPAMKRSNITMFAQMVQRIDTLAFQNLVNKFETDKHAKGIKTRDQLIAMLFCHFAGCESLREISDGLHACVGKLNHVDARPIGRSSLSYVNANRTYKVYEAFYYILLKNFESVLNGRVLKKGFKKPVYSLDFTLITLCLTLFDWARYRTSKGGIKLHTLLFGAKDDCDDRWKAIGH